MKIFRPQTVPVVAVLLLASAAAAASKPVALALKFPKSIVEPKPVMVPAIAAGPLAFSLVDARVADDPAIIGALRDKGQDVYRWRAGQPVGPAVEGFVAELLRAWSIPVASAAELNLQLALMRYYVTEKPETFGSTYIAEVRFMVSVTDRAGVVLWSGEGNGEAKRPGVDSRAGMCNEALSVALRRALSQALASVKLETAAPADPAAAAPDAAQPTTFVAPPISVEPEALYSDLTRLLAGGVTEDVLVSYVTQRKLTRPLTVDEILKWKNAGIPDAAIQAATRP